MSKNVLALGLVAQSVNEDAVSLLEEALERAKAGETIAVGIVEVRRARTVASSYCTSDCYHELLSGATRLQVRLATEPEDSE